MVLVSTARVDGRTLSLTTRRDNFIASLRCVKKRRLLAIALALTLASGCGGGLKTSDSKGGATAKSVDQPDVGTKANSKELSLFFTAVAESDIDKLTEAKKLAAPDSIAFAYASEQLDVANSVLDSGTPTTDPQTLKETDDGYEGCVPDGADCTKWADIESRDGKIANFTVNGKEINDRLSIGNGKTVDVGNIASVEFLSAYQSAQSDILLVNLKVKSKGLKVSQYPWNATYRAPDGRTAKAGEAILGPEDMEPNSLSYVTVMFEHARPGGDIKLQFYDANDNEFNPVVKTG